jgi:hypothetical protein
MVAWGRCEGRARAHSDLTNCSKPRRARWPDRAKARMGRGACRKGARRAGRRGLATGHRRERVRDGPGRKGGNRPAVAPGRPLLGAGRAGSAGPGQRVRDAASSLAGPWVHGQNRKFPEAQGLVIERPGGDGATGCNVVREPDASGPTAWGCGDLWSGDVGGTAFASGRPSATRREMSGMCARSRRRD